MPYIYVLATGNLAAPWSRHSTYDGRYLRCATSGFGTTGGADQHRHLTVATNSGTSANTVETYQGGNSRQANHTHPLAATYSSYSNNDPYFYTLSLWRMDATTWETSYRYFPAGVVVASTAAISSTGFARFTSADNRLIKLGDPGSSGGRTTHTDHTLDLTLESNSGSVGLFNAAGGPAMTLNTAHTHAGSVASFSSADLLPARVKTRLYYTTVATDHAPANIVCFFDGAPSANWEAVSWSGRFLMSADSNPTNEGADSHGHDNVSGTSSNAALGTSGTGMYASPYATWVTTTHNHPFTAVQIGSSDHKPLYVDLVPYRLKIRLDKITTVPKTVSVSTLIKRISTKTFNASVRLRKTVSKTVDTTVTVSKHNIGEEFELTAKLRTLEQPKEFELATDLRTQRFIFSFASVVLRAEGSSLGLSARLVKRPIPGLILDSMVKSYVRQFDKIQMLVQGMAWANRIESAIGEELDLKWGHVFSLPRERGESDQDYRERLVVFTPLLVGSGAPAPLKTALDYVTGYPGTSEIDTYWPAETVIRFTHPEAIRMARDRIDSINAILERGIISGVSHEVILPIADFGLSCRLWGSTEAPFILGARLLTEGVETEFGIGVSVTTRNGEAFDLDLILKLIRVWPQNVSVLIEARRETGFPVSARVRAEVDEPVPVSTLLLRRSSEDLAVAARLLWMNRAAEVPVSSRLRRTKVWPYYVRAGIKKVGIDGGFSLSAVVAA